jgi:hypothetical protein
MRARVSCAVVVLWLALTAFVAAPALGKKKPPRRRKKATSRRKPDPALAVEDPAYPRLDVHCAESDALQVLAAGEVSSHCLIPFARLLVCSFARLLVCSFARLMV